MNSSWGETVKSIEPALSYTTITVEKKRAAAFYAVFLQVEPKKP